MKLLHAALPLSFTAAALVGCSSTTTEVLPPMSPTQAEVATAEEARSENPVATPEPMPESPQPISFEAACEQVFMLPEWDLYPPSGDPNLELLPDGILQIAERLPSDQEATLFVELAGAISEANMAEGLDYLDAEAAADEAITSLRDACGL